jgi:NADPH-dependent glutamate synthase beta subunit-like oxidoreductase
MCGRCSSKQSQNRYNKKTTTNTQVRAFAAEQYRATGLNLHPGLSPVEVRKQPDGRLTVVLASADGKERLEIADNDQVLMAAGRDPKTAGLGLEDAGVKLGRKGEVVVDEYSRTSVPSIWAVGDVRLSLFVFDEEGGRGALRCLDVGFACRARLKPCQNQTPKPPPYQPNTHEPTPNTKTKNR